MLSTWSTVLRDSFTSVSTGVISFLPNLVVAIIIILVGWAIGILLDKVIAHIISALKVDSALRGAKIDEVLKRAGYDLDAGAFLGGLVKWFVIVVFLVASLDVLGLKQVNVFLQQVVLIYLPQVIVAVLILLVAAVIAEAMQKIVVGTASAAGIRSANLAGTITRWSIWIFAILMALFQLGIAAPFVQTLFTGFVVALALGFGLSFGLGGQDAAAKLIDRVRDEVSHRGGK